MEWAHATGDGACRRLCLEWQDLFQPVAGRLCDYRHPLEWAAVLRPARQVIAAILSMTPRSTVRCAIYTRVSTEQGLEQDFNSLDAQDDASRAYISGQAYDVWPQLPPHYVCGDISDSDAGGPVPQKLRHDVRA